MKLPVLDTVNKLLQTPLFSTLLPKYIRIDQNSGDIILEQEFYHESSHRTKILALLLGLKVKKYLGFLVEESTTEKEITLLCPQLNIVNKKIHNEYVRYALEELEENRIVKREGKKFWVPEENLPNAEKLLREKLYGPPGLLSDLRELSDVLVDIGEKTYLYEIIRCLSVKAFRAVIIMTWILCMERLQNYILKYTKLNDFNLKLSQAYPKLKQVNDKHDFSDLKESIFIEICKNAGIITKDVWKILDEKLNFRNSCAHPSDIVIPESKVTSFVEDLLHNFLLKYKI